MAKRGINNQCTKMASIIGSSGGIVAAAKGGNRNQA